MPGRFPRVSCSRLTCKSGPKPAIGTVNIASIWPFLFPPAGSIWVRPPSCFFFVAHRRPGQPYSIPSVVSGLGSEFHLRASLETL